MGPVFKTLVDDKNELHECILIYRKIYKMEAFLVTSTHFLFAGDAILNHDLRLNYPFKFAYFCQVKNIISKESTP